MGRWVQGTLHPTRSECRVDLLSERVREVLRLVAVGKSNREIAKELDLGIYRLRSLRRTLIRKTGASNTARLTRLAMSTPGVGSIASESSDPVDAASSR
jgi:DNA-binding CsgD family transcriptional regulator